MITIRNLDVFYGDLHALRNVTFAIPRGEIVSLIGPSGCGKSVLLRVLNQTAGAEAYAVGAVTMDAGDILDPACDVFQLRRQVGLVTARPTTFPMSIWDNIVFGPRMSGVRGRSKLDSVVEQALSEAELWDEVKDRLHKPALRLSDGQQQRLCIARALALEPKVLLMDEVTSTLDPIATGRIEQLIERLKAKITIVMVTHAVQQASRVSDRTAFFHLGELIEYGRTEDVFTQPQDHRTAEYISGRFVK